MICLVVFLIRNYKDSGLSQCGSLKMEGGGGGHNSLRLAD